MRIPHPPHLRDTLLAKRWTQPELLSAGLVDEVVDGDKLMNAAVERAVKEGVKVGAGAWGALKVSFDTAGSRWRARQVVTVLTVGRSVPRCDRRLEVRATNLYSQDGGGSVLEAGWKGQGQVVVW